MPQNDVALLALATPIDNWKDVIPISSPRDADQLLKSEDARLLIAGWGRTAFGDDRPLSNSLLHAFVPVIDLNKCNSPDMYDGLVKDSMICASVGTSGTGAVDACQGDSGGPAMMYMSGKPYLEGLVSWGVGCGNGKYPGVYVKISGFSGWITSEMSK